MGASVRSSCKTTLLGEYSSRSYIKRNVHTITQDLAHNNRYAEDHQVHEVMPDMTDGTTSLQDLLDIFRSVALSTAHEIRQRLFCTYGAQF
jgi:hypothetical protein